MLRMGIAAGIKSLPIAKPASTLADVLPAADADRPRVTGFAKIGGGAPKASGWARASTSAPSASYPEASSSKLSSTGPVLPPLPADLPPPAPPEPAAAAIPVASSSKAGWGSIKTMSSPSSIRPADWRPSNAAPLHPLLGGSSTALPDPVPSPPTPDKPVDPASRFRPQVGPVPKRPAPTFQTAKGTSTVGSRNAFGGNQAEEEEEEEAFAALAAANRKPAPAQKGFKMAFKKL